MKKIFAILLLSASMALGQGLPNTTPVPNLIYGGRLTSDLDTNGFNLTKQGVTSFQPANSNLTSISNNPSGVTSIGLTLLGEPDLPTLQTYVGAGSGTTVNNKSPVAGQFFTGFIAPNFSTGTVAYANVTGTPTLPANTGAIANQWINSYNSATGAFTQTQPAFSNISGVAVASQLPALNFILAPTADVSLNSHKIINLAIPTNAGDAAPKTYVDAQVAAGIPPPHAAVAAATTGNITLSGEQAIDGVSTTASRVLVKNQTTASTNGIYVSAAGAWARSTDAAASGQMPGGIFVTGGSVNANTGWALSNTLPVVLGTDSLVYVQISAVPGYTPVSLTGETYLTLASQVITVGAVDLSGTNAKGILAAARFPALTGPVTTVAGSLATTITPNIIDNTLIAQMPTLTLKGNKTGATANAADINVTDIKTMLSISNVENTALSTWAGSGAITTLGNIGTGTWNGTAVAVARGGTGNTTATGALNALLPSGTTNQALTRTATAYQFSDINVVVAKGRLTAQTTGNVNVATFTVGATDAGFDVSMNMNLISKTAPLSTQLEVQYTDETNLTWLIPFQVMFSDGKWYGAIVDAIGTGPYSTPEMHIRCKAATTITLKVVSSTFTTANYNVEGTITQIQ